MPRSVLLAALAAAYLAVGLRGRVDALLTPNRFDPFLPQARTVELRIGERRFAEALPLAGALAGAYPNEPLVAFWRARIHHGLGDSGAEAAAWEDFVRLSTTPAEACPALADAYARAGRDADAIAAFERCAAFAPDDPDRQTDLADAYARAARRDAARAAYAKAIALDPGNPALLARAAALKDRP